MESTYGPVTKRSGAASLAFRTAAPRSLASRITYPVASSTSRSTERNTASDSKIRIIVLEVVFMCASPENQITSPDGWFMYAQVSRTAGRQLFASRVAGLVWRNSQMPRSPGTEDAQRINEFFAGTCERIGDLGRGRMRD